MTFLANAYCKNAVQWDDFKYLNDFQILHLPHQFNFSNGSLKKKTHTHTHTVSLAEVSTPLT